MNEEKEEVLTMQKFKWEARKKQAKEFIAGIPAKVKKVWEEDKELILFFTPGVIYGVKRLTKINEGKKEDFHRNCQVFDHSLGMWHDLRRPMTAKEKLIFAKRRKAGESTLSILTSMNLLKR